MRHLSILMIVAFTAHTDKEGNFEIGFVRPGDILVHVEPFHMKDDHGRAPPIAGTSETVSEKEVKENVRLFSRE